MIWCKIDLCLCYNHYIFYNNYKYYNIYNNIYNYYNIECIINSNGLFRV